jgi:hypothetical protein
VTQRHENSQRRAFIKSASLDLAPRAARLYSSEFDAAKCSPQARRKRWQRSGADDTDLDSSAGETSLVVPAV